MKIKGKTNGKKPFKRSAYQKHRDAEITRLIKKTSMVTFCLVVNRRQAKELMRQFKKFGMNPFISEIDTSLPELWKGSIKTIERA